MDILEQDNIANATLARLPAEAQQLVARWTKGLTLVSCLKPDAGTVVTVSKDERDSYHVTAYFTVGASWAASCDAQGVTADEAFQALAIRMQ